MPKELILKIDGGQVMAEYEGTSSFPYVMIKSLPEEILKEVVIVALPFTKGKEYTPAGYIALVKILQNHMEKERD
ncbi:MAG: hypothetical protein JW812_00645 [Alphaproteobacteria bacterium]|nr:hypothetical protein [Alphaproteobacteria bacterium]MBN2779815.1 hypothetical protein [Alphaproteobacteria bacterium]